MAVLTVPRLDRTPWPSLGRQVCAFIEDYLVFGPGDLRGEPARLDDEKVALIYRMYEVYPKGHPMAGRRRFKRCAISLRKGTAKTELAAWIAACELHREGPVRCDGFDSAGEPVGVGVRDPYIPLVAYTEEQSDELAYHALRVILEYSELANDFDIGQERIMRTLGDGKAVSLSTSPDARDGARTTFQVFDETHRFTLARLLAAHRTMLANVPKRRLADAWSLETTTAPGAGEGSVAEGTMDYARKVRDGRERDTRLFYFHRYASDEHDLGTPEGLRAAVIEASGPAASWSDIDGIVDQWSDPTADRAYLRRVWLNQVVRGSERAFDVEQWKTRRVEDCPVRPGDPITIGFDGARVHDGTAIVCTHVQSGYQWLAGLWEEPLRPAGSAVESTWEVPPAEVEEVLAHLFETYHVVRMYCDPPYWETYVATWAGRWGDDVVLEWWTNRRKPMAYAIRAYRNAIMGGEISHGEGIDSEVGTDLTRHIGNAVRGELQMRDEEGAPLWLIYKERRDSPNKIDAAVAGVISWEARNDAIAAGAGPAPRSAYEEHGILMVRA